MIKALLTGFVALVLIIPLALFFNMKISPVSWGLLEPVNESNGIVLSGYDPVAYFYEGTAVKGDPNNGLRHDGFLYRFSSDENKLMFKTFPDKFTPQYGGYCAHAISSGYIADSNPLSWKIHNDKLFIFFDDSAKEDFTLQIDSNITQADNNWSQR